LISEEKKGVYVNPDFYQYFPGSINRKYDFKFDTSKFKINGKILHKEYLYKNQMTAYVETELVTDVFRYNKYIIGKTFMFNLATNNLIVTKVESDFSVVKIKEQEYVLEKRRLYDADDLLISKEKIYVNKMFFKQKIKTKFL
jgi:hypothetical protein